MAKGVAESMDAKIAKGSDLFDAQDAIDQQREDLFGKIEKQLKHNTETQTLFTIRWRVR